MIRDIHDAGGLVAVICGGGTVPFEVVQSAKAAGRDVLVVAIKDEAAPEIDAFSPVRLGWGQIGKLFNTLKQAACRDVVLIGSVHKRPDFRAVAGDLGTIRRIPRIVSALKGGDDSLLVKVIGLFEEEGFRVIGAHELSPDLLVRPGLLVGKALSADMRRDMELAREASAALGRLDIGQAAVAVDGRVIALEGAEGTDAMLARCAELKRIGRVRSRKRGGMLVKRSKPNQDLRVDLPTVGPDTIEAAAAAALSGIALEAGRVLIAERDRTLKLAERHDLTLLGFERAATG